MTHNSVPFVPMCARPLSPEDLQSRSPEADESSSREDPVVPRRPVGRRSVGGTQDDESPIYLLVPPFFRIWCRTPLNPIYPVSFKSCSEREKSKTGRSRVGDEGEKPKMGRGREGSGDRGRSKGKEGRKGLGSQRVLIDGHTDRGGGGTKGVTECLCPFVCVYVCWYSTGTLKRLT